MWRFHKAKNEDSVGVTWAAKLNPKQFIIFLRFGEWINRHPMTPIRDFSIPGSGRLRDSRARKTRQFLCYDWHSVHDSQEVTSSLGISINHRQVALGNWTGASEIARALVFPFCG
jgi:hypothetical protein